MLDLDGPATDIAPLAGRIASRSLARGRPARASNVFQEQATFGPDKAVDDDEGTRWATDEGTHAAWLEVDLGSPQLIGRVVLREEYGRRVQKFELQYQDGNDWKTFATAGEIGPELRMTVGPVTARIVRLNILSATEGRRCRSSNCCRRALTRRPFSSSGSGKARCGSALCCVWLGNAGHDQSSAG
ncbi:MAG: discoidin domain-containing protein [Phycisphaerales bacterium]|nr:discoidin domain-containing protein [Phycisphaerales bacterium]